MSASVAVKNIVIGTGRPKICIPLMDPDPASLSQTVSQLGELPFDLVEWRADALKNPLSPDVRLEALTLLRRLLPRTPILFTLRTAAEGGLANVNPEEYEEILMDASRSGLPDLVDIELSWGEERTKRLLYAVHERSMFAVGSRHNFKATPSKEEIVHTLRIMQELGCDLAKYAVMPRCERDVLTLLDATLTMKEHYPDTPVITMSMGPLGAVSRISGELFGSALTFGTAGTASAPGQLPARTLSAFLQQLSVDAG